MQTRIDELILKHLWGDITPDEEFELNEFKSQSEENRILVDDLTNRQHLFRAIQRKRSLNREASLQKAKEELFKPKVSRARYYWIAGSIAAAIALIVICMAWLFVNKYPEKKDTYVKKEKPSMPYHQAILTLSNGQVLKLNELEDGFLGDDQMITKKDGQLIYPIDYKPTHRGMNILETPKGNSYILRLSDGSTIWLNSGSSIQFPNSFTGNERTVTINGDVYFDVAENPSKPFIVQMIADGSEIEVVGTRFSVNAYKGENTARTTLLEGKVRIKGEGYIDSLKAGEQLIAKAGRKVKKLVVDSAETRIQGWKENKFKWVKADVRTMLEDISHWHGHSLKYKVNVPSDTYNVVLNRSEPLNNIFKVLHKATLLNFKLEGTTIVVY